MAKPEETQVAGVERTQIEKERAEEDEEEGHERPVLRRGDESIRARRFISFCDDDGDFDDLYGNAPNKSAAGKATTTAATAAGPHFTDTDMRARQPQAAPVSARSSVDNGAYSYPVSPVSSIPSTTYSRSDAGGGGISHGGGATPSGRTSESNNRRASQQTARQKKQSAKAKNASRRPGDGGSASGREQKIRRKGSEELFNVDWDDDDAVKACFLCSSSFSLMKRKHHCRHCGHVICSDCSVFRYFEISHKKHRVCTTCNNELARANRLGDSDADDNLDRSVVTDDDAEYAYATPSNSSRKKRSKLRESLKKTFTPKHDKKKEARQVTAPLERKSEVDKKTERAVYAVQPKEHEEDEQKQSSDLFDLADDTWFTDSLMGKNGTAKRKDRHLNLDHDEDDFLREDTTQNRYSSAQSKQRTAAEEWQDAMSRHTIAANGGARVPPRGVYDSLSIDAYASRSDDEYNQRRARMEMPRPEEQQLVVRRAPIVEPNAKQPENETDGRFSSHGRPTLKESLKDIFYVHSKKKGSEKRKEKKKVKREESSENKGVFPSPPPPADSIRGMLAVGSAQPAVFTQVRPTFYEADVDELVVDDTPGYFDRASRENFRSPAREQRILTDSFQWGAAPLPKSVEPRAIASDQESYSIVEPPTESMGGQEAGETNTSGAPVSSPESSGHGFTGALKRLFGISGSKSPAKQVNQEAPEPANQAAETEKDSNDFRNVDTGQLSISSPAEGQTSLRESNILQRAGSFDRFSMTENAMVPYHESGQQDQFRYTMASEYATTGGDFWQPTSEQKRVSTFSGAASIRDLSQKKRRDTFDDLFASPKSQANSSSNGASQPARAWNGIMMESPFVVPPTGVDRFDRRKDDFGAYQEHEIKGLTPSIYAIDRSRASSIGLGESSLSSQRGNGEPSQAAGNSWSAISAEPSYGVATYAVPSSVSSDRFASSYARDDQGYTAGLSTHTSIMDDINHHVSIAPRSAQQANSVDDIFAEFERPNDYVFDPVTGGYVSASAPKRSREQPVRRDYSSQSSKQEPQSQMYSKELTLGQYQQYDSRPAAAESENEDGLDDTIVDKISSLEGELAALKQLIRKRKDHDQPVSTSRKSQTTTHRSSSNAAVPPRANEQSSRKLSIFDHDSSDEDVVARKKNGKTSTKNKGALEISPIKESRKSQKKKTKRRDSFADLFEDSPIEDSALGGGRGYESLFQTGSSKESGSDGEDAPSLRRRRDGSIKTSAKTTTGRKNAEREPESDDEEDYPPLKPRGRGARDLEEEEEDYPSLKNRSKGSSQRKTEKPVFRAAADSVSLSDEEEKPIPHVKASSKPTDTKEQRSKKSAKSTRVEFDPIDALFDSSSERDVTNFFDFGNEKNTPEKSRDQKVEETKVESIEAEDNKHSQITKAKSSDFTPPDDMPVTEEANSDEEFALSLAKAKKRRSQPESHSAAETTMVSGVAQAKKEASVSRDDSEIDSDEEFALTLKKGRSGVLKLASPDVRPVFSDTVSSESAVQESSQLIAKDELVDSDEEFALSLKTKMPRGKSVSFFDQPKEEIESSQPTLESLDEVFKNRDSAEESDLPAAAERYNLFDDRDSVMSSTPRDEPNLTDKAETINQNIPKSSASEESVIESTQDSTGELGSDLSSNENESAFKNPVQVAAPEPVQAVDIPAEAIIVAAEDSTSLAGPARSSTRKSTHILGVEDVALGIFDQSTDVYSVSLGSSGVVDEESEEGSDGEDAYSETFSFEVKPKKRAVQTQDHLAEMLLPKKKAAEDDGEALILGKYASGTTSVQQQPSTESRIDTAIQESTATEQAVSSPLDADVLPLEPSDGVKAEADWQQMQEQEKERRKKLQLKQRQAQRDKLLKKQGASSKQLSAPNSSSSASSSSTGEKKKKKKDKSATDFSTLSGSRKKSSSKKPRHKSRAEDEGEQSKNIDSSTTSMLTEL